MAPIVQPPMSNQTTEIPPLTIYCPKDLPFLTGPPRVLSPPLRLMSPICLAERRQELSSASPSICTTTTPHRRRSVRPIRPSRRPRHCEHIDCPIASTPHAFDDLPWISALDTDMPPDHVSPWDIADLSQLSPDEDRLSSGPGPIRRRKTSLRSSPLAPPTVCLPEDTVPPPLPLHEASNWSTPRSRIHRSRLHFRNLMPLFSACSSPYPFGLEHSPFDP